MRVADDFHDLFCCCVPVTWYIIVPYRCSRSCRHRRNSGGYCELCKVYYTSLRTHVVSNSHQAFVTDPANYAQLDSLINSLLPNPDSITTNTASTTTNTATTTIIDTNGLYNSTTTSGCYLNLGNTVIASKDNNLNLKTESTS